MTAKRATVLLIISLLLVSRAFAADGGTDAPIEPGIIRLPGDSYLVNRPAWDKLNTEMIRLQQVERQHKDESWVAVVLVGMGVGLLIGVPTGLLIGYTAAK